METARQIQQTAPDLTSNPYLLVVTGLSSGDTQMTEDEMSKLQRIGNTEASLWLGGLRDLYRGKVEAAMSQWQEYIESVGRPNRPKESRDWISIDEAHLWLARIALLADRPQEARRHLQMVKNVRDEYLAEAGKYYARLGDTKRASEILDDLRKRLIGQSTNQNRSLIRMLEAEIQFQSGNLRESFSLISEAHGYPWTDLYWAVQESRAHIAIASGNFDEAIAACTEMVARKGFAFSWDRPDDWVMAHYYLGRAYESSGKKALAISYYSEFGNAWAASDARLHWLSDARSRAAALQP